jgi:hypothetical protein
MSDLRVQHGPSIPQGPPPVGHGHRGGEQERRREERDREPRRGMEELAVALDEHGRGSLVARFEQDAEGAPAVRIVDRESGETVALLTPDELRELSERAGLPSGLLLQIST